MSVKPSLLVIAGPTASGKSLLAMKFAEVFGVNELVNLDSVQVFRDLDIGSGKILEEDRKGIKHHLLDSLGPKERIHAGNVVVEANKLIDAMVARQNTPIVCAGTTMYLSGLLSGLVEAPEADAIIKQELREVSTVELYEQLILIDPKRAAQLHRNDRARIQRAVEVFYSTNCPLGEKLIRHKSSPPVHTALMLVLCWPRAVLHQRIAERCLNMMEEGLIEETRGLLEKYGPEIQGLKTVGYKECVAYLQGNLVREKLLDCIIQASRQLAKRQMTFWRNEPKKKNWSIRQGEHYLGTAPAANGKRKSTIKDFIGLKLDFNALFREVESWRSGTHDISEVWYIDAQSLGLFL